MLLVSNEEVIEIVFSQNELTLNRLYTELSAHWISVILLCVSVLCLVYALSKIKDKKILSVFEIITVVFVAILTIFLVFAVLSTLFIYIPDILELREIQTSLLSQVNN